MFDYAAARAHMVESQVRTNDVTDHGVQNALRLIPRENFVPASKQAVAYGDVNVKTDEGRYMLRPRDFAKLVQAAAIKSTDIVLDIGCGRGYSSAVLAQLAETVVGLDEDEAGVERASELLTQFDVMNAAIVQGDLKGGAREHGPFDVIFVNGAVSSVPKPWFEQLASGGRLVVIMSNGPIGQATVYTKVGDTVGERIAFDASAPVLPGFGPKSEFVF